MHRLGGHRHAHRKTFCRKRARCPRSCRCGSFRAPPACRSRVRPLCCGLSVEESAQLLLRKCVSVMARMPMRWYMRSTREIVVDLVAAFERQDRGDLAGLGDALDIGGSESASSIWSGCLSNSACIGVAQIQRAADRFRALIKRGHPEARRTARSCRLLSGAEYPLGRPSGACARSTPSIRTRCAVSMWVSMPMDWDCAARAAQAGGNRNRIQSG